jgi:hypothetical protein
MRFASHIDPLVGPRFFRSVFYVDPRTAAILEGFLEGKAIITPLTNLRAVTSRSMGPNIARDIQVPCEVPGQEAAFRIALQSPPFIKSFTKSIGCEEIK